MCLMHGSWFMHTPSDVQHARADDPAADYLVVRQELALYNAEYCARPHVVALNKMDLDDAAELREEVASDIMAAAKAMQVGTTSRSKFWSDAAACLSNGNESKLFVRMSLMQLSTARLQQETSWPQTVQMGCLLHPKLKGALHGGCSAAGS